jgi:hypothetical protein
MSMTPTELQRMRETWRPLSKPYKSPARIAAEDGRWTVDACAPLDGRVVNGEIRLSF